ncbi:hypothetical protein [Phenylobacterium sp.]|jgi:hypothetical protein|uniref:hypothetical protein n=1 Tax=Phenylobacterium sp. TaxID=1871053 RepID=UPI002F923C7F
MSGRRKAAAAADGADPNAIMVGSGWQPRPHQDELWRYLQAGGRRADVAAHRRWGKDEVALNWAAAAATAKQGTYWHLLPEATQARKAIWDAVNPHSGKRRIDEAFKREHRLRRWDSDMKIELKNGSIWQLAGSDNYNSLVGSPPVGVVFSEWSLAKPDAWTYLRPILAENGGWALFLWTPRGLNHATRAFESRKLRPDEWLTIQASARHTNVFTPEQLERERTELIAELGSREEGEARFASEYLVDFSAAVPGSYFGSALREAEAQGRIGRVPWDPALKVDTAWDLGVNDATAIWFFQQVGQEVRAIDYFETSGEGFDAIVREAVRSKPYVYGRHHLPHDVAVREMAVGRSRYDTLWNLGVSPIEVGVAMNPEERVNAARLMIPITWFDATKCALGLDRLRAYRKRWVKATRTYGGPMHDDASHGADAFGEFAANRRGATKPNPRGPRRELGEFSWMA